MEVAPVGWKSDWFLTKLVRELIKIFSRQGYRGGKKMGGLSEVTVKFAKCSLVR